MSYDCCWTAASLGGAAVARVEHSLLLANALLKSDAGLKLSLVSAGESHGGPRLKLAAKTSSLVSGADFVGETNRQLELYSTA